MEDVRDPFADLRAFAVRQPDRFSHARALISQLQEAERSPTSGALRVVIAAGAAMLIRNR